MGGGKRLSHEEEVRLGISGIEPDLRTMIVGSIVLPPQVVIVELPKPKEEKILKNKKPIKVKRRK